MKRNANPPSLSPRALKVTGAVAFTVSVAFFATLAWHVSRGESPLLAFDEPAAVMANETVQTAYLGEPL